MEPSAARVGVLNGCPAVGVAVALCLSASFWGGAARAAEGDLALTVYTGRLTNNTWEEVLFEPGSIDLADSYLLAAGLARTLGRYWEDAVALEIEGQVVKHFGDQDHWEFNLPLVGRWQRFPWSATVATSVAFGVGPSYATEVPPEEVRLKGDSEQFLFHWFIEVTVGPPGSPWAADFRLHHRSTGFGLLGEGGSDFLTAGIRYRF